MRFVLVPVVVVTICSCPAPSVAPPLADEAWTPSTSYPSQPTVFRGFRDVRGLVHAHSVYSHDACDGEPVDENGVRNAPCFEDFRRGLCQSQHDFVFLTDHNESFADTEFPETLLHRAERGDVLIDHGNGPTANRMACEDGHTALVMAGSESGLMPVGIERHPVPHDQRDTLYGAMTADAADALRGAGAVVLLAHPENFTIDELLALPVDGFEMFNLHANAELNAAFVLDVIVRLDNGETVPHPDLLLAGLWSEDARYLERWGRALARGKRVVSTAGTDCHQNTFRTVLEDGERADSYRRMMRAFSNHLRVRVPTEEGAEIDDRALKEALAAGRNWGAFEMLGYPVGYDAFAAKGDDVFEMGDNVPAGAVLSVKRPSVEHLDPTREPPVITLRVLRAVDDAAGFEEIAAAAEGDLDVPLEEAGAYRAEVRMVPRHLREDFRDDANLMLQDGRDFVWIYGGTFVVP